MRESTSPVTRTGTFPRAELFQPVLLHVATHTAFLGARLAILAEL